MKTSVSFKTGRRVVHIESRLRFDENESNLRGSFLGVLAIEVKSVHLLSALASFASPNISRASLTT